MPGLAWSLWANRLKASWFTAEGKLKAFELRAWFTWGRAQSFWASSFELVSLVYLRKSFKLDLPEGELSHGGELLPGGKLDIRCWNISKDIWDIWINQRLGDMMMFHLNTPPVSSKLSWMFVAGPTWWHQTFNNYMFNLWHYKTRQKREREKKRV